VLRRSFTKLLGGIALCPIAAADAQQKPTPVIGYLAAGSPGASAPFLIALREGLRSTGYVEGQNVAIEYRWAEGNYDRLPALAVDLVRHKVDAIATTSGTPGIKAVKNATSTIPIVFLDGSDPVADGLVASLARPAGNLTGVSMLLAELVPKRLDLLLELVPEVRIVALLVNPSNSGAVHQVSGVQQAARSKRIQVPILKASAENEIEAAFEALVKMNAGAIIVAADPFFFSRRKQVVMLASRAAVPAIYEFGEFAAAGGLIAYGPSLTAQFRRVGVYVGRVLAGAKPADLPVEQPTRFELVINLKTAKALDLTVPQAMLARADEVIE
jgi:ABC-type uncharacterized transport system substrate-binding protein